MLPEYLRALNLFVDGKGYAGRVEEVTLPKLAVKSEEYRGGGMDAPVEIDLGMEKLECDFTINEYDPALFQAFGLVPGNLVPVTMRGAFDNDGTIKPVVVNLEGHWREIDMGSWKAGEKATLKVSMALRSYKLEIDGTQAVEIDVVNMKRKLNGNDLLADVRGAIGL